MEIIYGMGKNAKHGAAELLHAVELYPIGFLLLESLASWAGTISRGSTGDENAKFLIEIIMLKARSV